MKISTKGRYGLRCVIDLATYSKGRQYVSLSSIAQRQNLSVNYLEHIFSTLKKAGLVIGLSGSQGGYTLADDPKNITIGQVLDVLEGNLSVSGDTTLSDETQIRRFIKQKVWDKIDSDIQHLVCTTTLSDLIN